MSDSTETTPEYRAHIGKSRQYVRDIILGVNDGLVSTFLLVSAVVGGGLDATQVLLTGVSGALAGMISMAIGEYLATKSQEEVLEAEMLLEREHLRDHRDHEREQLAEMLGDMGLEGDDLDTVVHIIDSNEEAMFGMQAALEFGVVDSERRNPIAAGLASGALFLGGAIPPIIPFVFMTDTGEALIVSAALSSIGLFAVGAVKTLATKKSAVLSGLENLALGLLGAALAYLVGRSFDSLIS